MKTSERAVKGKSSVTRRKPSKGTQPVKKTVEKKSSAAKAPRTRPVLVSKPGKAVKRATPAKAQPAGKGLTDSQKKIFRDMLFNLRERLQGQISALKGDALVRNDGADNGEDGSDFFERQFALNIVSTEREAVLEIDESLRRLAEGTYGKCESCSGMIESQRLTALPFVRNCIKCQSQSETGKVKFRPIVAREEI